MTHIAIIDYLNKYTKIGIRFKSSSGGRCEGIIREGRYKVRTSVLKRSALFLRRSSSSESTTSWTAGLLRLFLSDALDCTWIPKRAARSFNLWAACIDMREENYRRKGRTSEVDGFFGSTKGIPNRSARFLRFSSSESAD